MEENLIIFPYKLKSVTHGRIKTESSAKTYKNFCRAFSVKN